MAANPTPIQLSQLQDLLLRDGNSNHQLLTYYLKLILNNRPLELKMPDGTPFQISPQLAWDEILKWNEKAGLPMGDKGSRQIRASRLLNYLDVVQGNTREAATSFQSIKDSAQSNALKSTKPSTKNGRELKKILDLRNLQIEIHNRQVLGQLATQLEQTSFIKRFAGDRPTQIAIAGLFAANAANFINADVPRHIMADEITKLVQLNAGRTASINNAAHLAYSQAAQDGELAEITTTIGSFVSKKYKSTDEFITETGRISHLSHILTVSDIPELVNMLAPSATAATRANLARALQTTIIRSTDDYYTSGETILSHAFNLAGLPESEAQNLSSLAPFLEEIRVTELHNTVSGDISENDPRIQNTRNLSGEIGVSAHIAWLTREDLDAQAVNLQKKYGSEDLSSTLEHELTQGDKADFEKISDIKKLFSNIEQHNYYNRTLTDNPLYYLRDKIGKTRGRFAAVTAPIDRFSQKIGKKVWAVDDFVHAPARYLADQWGKLEEKVPILNPGKFIYDKFTGAQLWVAQRVLEWSDNLIGRGHWAAGMLSHVSDFTRGFIAEGGSWGSANYTFVQKKWGDLLEWGAKKAGNKAGWQGVKASIGTKLWDGFAKLAPGLAEKLSAGSLGKLVTSFMAGTLSAGTTLLIQAGLMIIGAGLTKIWHFITNKNGFRTKFINNLPIYLSMASTALIALPGALVGGLIAFGSGALAFLGSALGALFTSIFLPALIAAGSMILGFFLLFQIFNITKDVDSGASQLIASIVCDQSKQTSSSATANVALCIADIVNNCPGLNPITVSKLGSSSWQCLLGGLAFKNAITELEKSAHVSNGGGAPGNVQCVGLSAASAADGDGSFSVGQINACSYATSVPNGYKYISGCSGMQPGDHFIMGAERCGATVGHIGVIIEPDGGSGFTCVDANFLVPGQIRGPDSCHFVNSQISGCLRKM